MKQKKLRAKTIAKTFVLPKTIMIAVNFTCSTHTVASAQSRYTINNGKSTTEHNNDYKRNSLVCSVFVMGAKHSDE